MFKWTSFLFVAIETYREISKRGNSTPLTPKSNHLNMAKSLCEFKKQKMVKYKHLQNYLAKLATKSLKIRYLLRINQAMYSTMIGAHTFHILKLFQTTSEKIKFRWRRGKSYSVLLVQNITIGFKLNRHAITSAFFALNN